MQTLFQVQQNFVFWDHPLSFEAYVPQHLKAFHLC